jgi:cell division inhibitor SulA
MNRVHHHLVMFLCLVKVHNKLLCVVQILPMLCNVLLVPLLQSLGQSGELDV